MRVFARFLIWTEKSTSPQGNLKGLAHPFGTRDYKLLPDTCTASESDICVNRKPHIAPQAFKLLLAFQKCSNQFVFSILPKAQ